MTMGTTLRPKQLLFVQEYLVDFNATQAAIRAGYSRKTARSIAQENLTKPIIVEAIAIEQNRLTAETELTIERVLYQLACVCFFDFRKLFDTRGQPKQPYELDPETAAAVAGLNIIDGQPKYRICSKTEALNMAGRYLKLFKEDAPTQPQAGMFVLLAPAPADPQEWTKVVQQHQLLEAQ
jgi:phage terminase small subunit